MSEKMTLEEFEKRVDDFLNAEPDEIDILLPEYVAFAHFEKKLIRVARAAKAYASGEGCYEGADYDLLQFRLNEALKEVGL